MRFSPEGDLIMGDAHMSGAWRPFPVLGSHPLGFLITRVGRGWAKPWCAGVVSWDRRTTSAESRFSASAWAHGPTLTPHPCSGHGAPRAGFLLRGRVGVCIYDPRPEGRGVLVADSPAPHPHPQFSQFSSPDGLTKRAARRDPRRVLNPHSAVVSLPRSSHRLTVAW